MDMDLVGPVLDTLLAVLLIAALLYGMRLERKLKKLRDTQAGFAEAVQALDVAAARAETGLDTLRRTAEDAHDGLHDRISKARELKAEMERLIGRAERAVETLSKTPEPAPARAPTVLPTRTLAVVAPSESRRGRVTFVAPVDDDALVLTELAEPAPRPANQPRRPPARGLDEDLFESPAAAPARGRRIFGVRG